MLKEYELTLDWRGFELHPETPRGGMLLERLFPGRLEAMRARTLGFARTFGVEGMNPPDRLPNTRRVLAMAELARDEGKLQAFREAAMDGYWREGRDLENDPHLRNIAERAGLNPIAALAATDDPSFQARVDAIRAEASAIGVTGIPTFIFNDRLGVVGCQPFEELAAAADEVGAKRRKREQADPDPTGGRSGR